MPARRSFVTIKDFPVGLSCSSSSSTPLEIVSHKCEITQYQYRELAKKKEKTASLKSSELTVLSSSARRRKTTVKPQDVLVVHIGRVGGSSGAPYFAEHGKVVAFHVESIDDDDGATASPNSHTSYSRGYVLCRLPNFVRWYNRTMTDKRI